MNPEFQITRISIDDALEIFEKLGWKVTRNMIESDLRDGAPQNDDGTLNLIEYGAWLLKEMSYHEN